MSKINRADLVALIADNTGMTKKETDTFLTAFTEVVSSELVKGNIVSIMGFGNFEVRKRSERTGVNPKTGKKISIPSCKTPAFKVSKSLKVAVNSEV